ncbi:hypothetical protein AA0118_g3936 [Alternaria tenuissima]|nr:hypothetical protein AA0118_g3936 [Alternaria tenuissima]
MAMQTTSAFRAPVTATTGQGSTSSLDVQVKTGTRGADAVRCGTFASGYTHVTRCNDGSFCCGDSNAACCNSYSGVYLNENGTEILQSSESGPLPDTTTSSTDVPYSSPIPTSLQTRVLTSTGKSTTNLPSQTATATNVTSADKPKEGLSTEAKIGIGVGVPAVILAALTLWRQCRTKGP